MKVQACLIFLMLMICLQQLGLAREVRQQPQESVVPTLKLGLSHIDFSEPNVTFKQRMQKAQTRSSLRLQHFEQSILIVVARELAPNASAAAAAGNYKTTVFAGEGAFMTTAAIGTPPVSFTAIVDTGSDLVWRQCKPCMFCYAQNSSTIFDPSQSSTFEHASCTDPLCNALPGTVCSPSCSYIYSYGDQSYTSGDLSYDTITLPDASSGRPHAIPHFAFGCGTDNENSNFAGAGGVIGLGQGPVSVPSQLALPKFSYCLQPITDAASQTSPLFLGPAATTGGTKNLFSTPIITNPITPTLYYIGLKGISVGGKLLSIPPGTFDLQPDGTGGMIIDSGTTLTYLTEAGYVAVLQAFQSAIKLPAGDGTDVGLDLCYTKSGVVPSLTFHFDGGDLELPADNYFISIDGLLFCLAMAESGSISIFGNMLQQNLHVLYDRSEKKLSITPAICDSL